MLKNIVLLHGWGAQTDKLATLKKELEKKKWNVLLPEIPGFGAKAPEKAWNLGNYSDFVSNQADKYFKNNKYFVFGHSFGGRISIKISFSNPKVSGLVLCASGGISRGNFLKRYFFSTVSFVGKKIFPKENYQVFRKLIYKLAREHDYEKTSGVMKEVFKNVVGEDLKPLISKINVPILILWGRVDKMTPLKDAMFIKSKVKNARLVIYQTGHKLPYEKPSELAKDIDLWSKKQF